MVTHHNNTLEQLQLLQLHLYFTILVQFDVSPRTHHIDTKFSSKQQQ